MLVYRAKEAEKRAKYKIAKNRAYEDYLDAKYKRDIIMQNPANDVTAINRIVEEKYAYCKYVDNYWYQWKKNNYAEMQREVNKSSHNI